MSSIRSAPDDLAAVLRDQLPELLGELIAQHIKAAPQLDRLAYTRQQAADATGYGYQIISQAIRAGDLDETFPEVNGRPLAKGVILREDLEAWIRENSRRAQEESR